MCQRRCASAFFRHTIGAMTQANSPNMAPTSNDEADTWIHTMARMLELPLEDANVAEIRDNVLVARRMAQSLGTAASEDHLEPLPVFHA